MARVVQAVAAVIVAAGGWLATACTRDCPVFVPEGTTLGMPVVAAAPTGDGYRLFWHSGEVGRTRARLAVVDGDGVASTREVDVPFSLGSVATSGDRHLLVRDLGGGSGPLMTVVVSDRGDVIGSADLGPGPGGHLAGAAAAVGVDDGFLVAIPHLVHADGIGVDLEVVRLDRDGAVRSTRTITQPRGIDGFGPLMMARTGDTVWLGHNADRGVGVLSRLNTAGAPVELNRWFGSDLRFVALAAEGTRGLWLAATPRGEVTAFVLAADGTLAPVADDLGPVPERRDMVAMRGAGYLLWGEVWVDAEGSVVGRLQAPAPRLAAWAAGPQGTTGASLQVDLRGDVVDRTLSTVDLRFGEEPAAPRVWDTSRTTTRVIDRTCPPAF